MAKNGREYHYITLRIPLPLYYYMERCAGESGESISKFCIYGLIYWAKVLLRGKASFQCSEYLPEDIHKQITEELSQPAD